MILDITWWIYLKNLRKYSNPLLNHAAPIELIGSDRTNYRSEERRVGKECW